MTQTELLKEKLFAASGIRIILMLVAFTAVLIYALVKKVEIWTTVGLLLIAALGAMLLSSGLNWIWLRRKGSSEDEDKAATDAARIAGVV